MPLYEMTDGALTPIPQTTFTLLGLWERDDIQRAVRARIDAITPGVSTMVLAEEFGNWTGANRRIDLLCLDSEARLVVVELKRANGVHMELQAIRYAAMVSAMRFDQAVEAHRTYLKKLGSTEDAETNIRSFLELPDGKPGALAASVRIVLAASDFPPELTTAVLWLNQQGLDIRCVQMRPHQINDKVLVDIQQVIPLPSASRYQVAIREKSFEQAAAKESSERDYTRYDLSVGDTTHTNLPKRRLAYEVVAEAIRSGTTPEQILAVVPWKGSGLFISALGSLTEQAFAAAVQGKPLDRFYTADEDLFRVGGSTYALSNQWGDRTLEAVEQVLGILPHGASIAYSPTTALAEEVVYGEHVVRQRENGTIEIELGGVPVQPVKPALRMLAAKLHVTLHSASGKEMNTRQLGAQVMKAIGAL